MLRSRWDKLGLNHGKLVYRTFSQSFKFQNEKLKEEDWNSEFKKENKEIKSTETLLNILKTELKAFEGENVKKNELQEPVKGFPEPTKGFPEEFSEPKPKNNEKIVFINNSGDNFRKKIPLYLSNKKYKQQSINSFSKSKKKNLKDVKIPKPFENISTIEIRDKLLDDDELIHLIDKFDENPDNYEDDNVTQKYEIFKSINNLKPNKPLTSLEYKNLNLKLHKGYLKKNLIEYLEEYHPGGKFKYKTKPSLISIILDEFWQIKVVKLEESRTQAIEQLSTKVYEASDKLIYMLLNNNASLLLDYHKNNISLYYIPGEKNSVTTLVVKAQDSKLKYFEADINRKLSRLHRWYFNFESLNNFFFKQVDNLKIPVEILQNPARILLKKVNEFGYMLFAQNGFGAIKFEIYMLNFLDYSSKISTKLYNFEKLIRNSSIPIKFFPNNQKDQLQTCLRSKKWFRLRIPTFNKTNANLVKSNYKIINNEDFENLYDELSLKKLENKDDPLLSVTFGQILVDSTMKDGKPDNSLIKPFTFTTNVPSLKREAYRLPLFFEKDSLIDDNHSYFIQIKFQPKLFYPTESAKHNSILYSKIDKYAEYPPVEIWIEQDSRGKIIWDSLVVKTIELERNVLVNLPNKSSDLKFSNTITDTLLDLSTEEIYDSIDRTIIKQPELMSFIKEAKIENSIHTQKLKKFINIDFFNADHEKSTIRYLLTGIHHHKQLNLEFESGFMLQLSEINGGVQGGNLTQVTMLNKKKQESEDENDKVKFQEFLRKSLKFTDYLMRSK